MSSSNYKYRSLQIEVSLSYYGRGWLAEYSIGGGPFQRCDGRPHRNQELAMNEGKSAAQARVDSMLALTPPLSV